MAAATPKAPETAARKGPARVPAELPKAAQPASKNCTGEPCSRPGGPHLTFAMIVATDVLHTAIKSDVDVSMRSHTFSIEVTTLYSPQLLSNRTDF